MTELLLRKSNDGFRHFFIRCFDAYIMIKFICLEGIKFMNTIKKIIHNEAFKYLVIGGCTTLVNLITFGVLVHFQLNVTIANIISIIISILFAYVTNKIIVFQSHCDSFVEVIYECVKFIGARLLTMAIEVGGVYLFVNIIGQAAMIGKLETQVIVIVGNYFISKFFVFK